MQDSERTALEAALGYRFSSPGLLARALTHSSHVNSLDPAAAGHSNEKLEFLGDAVLGLVVSEHVWQSFPDWEEGRLSKAVAHLVSAESLARAARRLNLGDFLKLGPGEEKTGGRDKPGLLADVYEAVLAAVYLDAGLDAAAGFVRRTLLDDEFRSQAGALGLSDRKSALQEHLQKQGIELAEYSVVGESGPDHEKRYQVEVRVQGRRLASGEGRSKKEAEQAAAGVALELLRRDDETREGNPV